MGIIIIICNINDHLNFGWLGNPLLLHASSELIIWQENFAFGINTGFKKKPGTDYENVKMIGSFRPQFRF
jgi:hypothetical protein